MPLPQSDLVQESKLKTIFSSNSTRHFFYERGTSNRDRKIQLKEKWKQRRFLGQGAYGTVWLETCDQPARDNGPRVRAVKRIPIDIMISEDIDYSRELEAVIKFSQPSVRTFLTLNNFVRVYAIADISQFLSIPRLLSGPSAGLKVRKLFSLPWNMSKTGIYRNISPSLFPNTKRRSSSGSWQKVYTTCIGMDSLTETLNPEYVIADKYAFFPWLTILKNILVVSKGPDWLVQISDFGISRRLQHEQGTLGTIQKGSFGFMAPEMLGLVNERDRPHAADIWSLGAILFRMLTKCLFLDLNTLPRYAGGEETFPMDKLDSISASDPLKELLQRLLAPSPRGRPSAAEAGPSSVDSPLYTAWRTVMKIDRRAASPTIRCGKP